MTGRARMAAIPEAAHIWEEVHAVPVAHFGEPEDNWSWRMQETAMLGKIALIVLVGVTVFGVSIASSLASRDDVRDNNDRGGSVVPCSLAGINPAYHPEVFGNPAAAFAQYGFTRSPDGTWHVVANCHR